MCYDQGCGEVATVRTFDDAGGFVMFLRWE
jgi:hypothetical protein